MNEILKQSDILPTTRQERMKRQARASKAENTWLAYSSDWSVWEKWAISNNMSSLPADPVHVAAFLSDMSESRKVATLDRYLTSITITHDLKNLMFDRRHRSIRTILTGIKREQGKGQRKVKPITVKLLKSMLEYFGDEPIDVRDGALLALGIAGGLRRSELSALNYQVQGDGTAMFSTTEDGATITFLKSKTSQDKPETVEITPGLALAAVKRWIEEAEIQAGTPLFRSIAKGGGISDKRLNALSIARIIKRRVATAGLDPNEFSGHSLRAGMITSAAEADVPEWRIKMHSRHKSDTVVRSYIRPIEKRRHSPVKDIGL